MARTLEHTVVSLGRGDGRKLKPRRAPTPLLSALEAAGTQHLYADTADVRELSELLRVDSEGAVIRGEIDGNTANQPLVRKVVERYLDADDPRAWEDAVSARQPNLARADLLPLLYAIVCGRLGNDMLRAFACGREWDASLQLHMDLCENAEAARWVGRLLHRMVPSALVKVPFTPDAPHCLLVARDLERAGIPVNLTSTFSARQVVVAALFAGVTRTNVFLGRLSQGLDAEQLGEHVTLEAQRALRALRQELGVRTRLIVASVREWQSFARLAGCDVFTAPCDVLRAFLTQQEIPPGEIESRLDTSYADATGVSPAVRERLGDARIARLAGVEPELVEFLRELRDALAHAPDAIGDGEVLYKRFDEAGFGDLFHSPSRDERQEMARGKLPDLDGALIERVPLDTHFSLLANADFVRHQRAIDEQIEARLDRGDDRDGASA